MALVILGVFPCCTHAHENAFIVNYKSKQLVKKLKLGLKNISIRRCYFLCSVEEVEISSSFHEKLSLNLPNET